MATTPIPGAREREPAPGEQPAQFPVPRREERGHLGRVVVEGRQLRRLTGDLGVHLAASTLIR